MFYVRVVVPIIIRDRILKEVIGKYNHISRNILKRPRDRGVGIN